jgi:hypothetical protein
VSFPFSKRELSFLVSLSFSSDKRVPSWDPFLPRQA